MGNEVSTSSPTNGALLLWVKGFSGGWQCCGYRASELVLDDGTKASNSPVPDLIGDRISDGAYKEALNQLTRVTRRYTSPSTMIFGTLVCVLVPTILTSCSLSQHHSMTSKTAMAGLQQA
eukprot:573897-Rhodomonas_salina.1